MLLNQTVLTPSLLLTVSYVWLLRQILEDGGGDSRNRSLILHQQWVRTNRHRRSLAAAHVFSMVNSQKTACTTVKEINTIEGPGNWIKSQWYYGELDDSELLECGTKERRTVAVLLLVPDFLLSESGVSSQRALLLVFTWYWGHRMVSSFFDSLQHGEPAKSDATLWKGVELESPMLDGYVGSGNTMPSPLKYVNGEPSLASLFRS